MQISSWGSRRIVRPQPLVQFDDRGGGGGVPAGSGVKNKPSRSAELRQGDAPQHYEDAGMRSLWLPNPWEGGLKTTDVVKGRALGLAPYPFQELTNARQQSGVSDSTDALVPRGETFRSLSFVEELRLATSCAIAKLFSYAYVPTENSFMMQPKTIVY